MKINRIHAVIGFLLIVVPLLGFGRTFKNGFSIFGGVLILYFAIRSIHGEYRKKHRRPHRHDTFVEGRPPEVKPKESESSDQAEASKSSDLDSSI